MMVHQAGMQNKQAFLFRLVDVGNELFAMAATCARTVAMKDTGHPDAEKALELTDLFCRQARRKIKRLFVDLWANDDNRKYRVALNVLKGKHQWLEKAVEGLEQEIQASEAAVAAPAAKRKKAAVSAVN